MGLFYCPKAGIMPLFRQGLWHLLLWAPVLQSHFQGHFSYWGGDCVQVGGPSNSSLMMWLVHTVTTPGAVITSTTNGSGDASGTSSGNWLLSRPLPPGNQESVSLIEQLLILVQGRGILWGWLMSANYEISTMDFLMGKGPAPQWPQAGMGATPSPIWGT